MKSAYEEPNTLIEQSAVALTTVIEHSLYHLEMSFKKSFMAIATGLISSLFNVASF